MPFAITAWPSIGLSLLKSALSAQGFSADILYLNIAFADFVGVSNYSPLSLGSPNNSDLLGEWVFSHALFDDMEDSQSHYLSQVILGAEKSHKKNVPNADLLKIWDLAQNCRAKVLAFMDNCISRTDWNSYHIAGFTSVFQQHVSALALAKKLKQRFPHLCIVFGGANCEGEMGLATLQNFDFVDAVCIGEGDIAFPNFVRSYASGSSEPIEGIVQRKGPKSYPHQYAKAPPVDMNAIPFPDFDDFFAQAPSDGRASDLPVRLIFETSRGCWWGQKNHCTFCGLNGSAMTFRQKTGERALREVQFLQEKYGAYTKRMSATDNIMPYRYFEEFLPKLASLKLELDIFYETKANLSKDQLRLYSDAGLNVIQPGIESLDTSILRLMRKGVSALQNIQLLKWCKELDILPQWNYLFGFPGEDPALYLEQPELIEKIRHLTPPVGCSRLRLDRFSPYVSHPRDFGISELSAYPVYKLLYPALTQSEINRIAYYFVGQFEGQDAIDAYTATLVESVNFWRKNEDHFLLTHMCGEDCTLVFDARNLSSMKVYILRNCFHDVHAILDGIMSLDGIRKHPLYNTEHECNLIPTIATLIDHGLVVEERGQYLGLSVLLSSRFKPNPLALERVQDFLGKNGGGYHKGSISISPENVKVLCNQ